MPKAKRSSGVLCLVLILAIHTASDRLQAQEPREKLRLIRAGSLERKEVRGTFIERLVGDVELRQGKTTIQCEVATHDPDKGLYTLSGSVKIFDNEQTLLADTVFVFERERRQIASGNVVNITPDDTTSAGRMVYDQNARTLYSEGDVRIASADSQRTVLTGEYAEYWREEKRGIVWGRPVLVTLDSLGAETSRIVADSMKTVEQNKKTIAIGEVTITRPNLVAKAARADYDREQQHVRMVGKPQVERENQTIRGDTLDLFLDDSRLKLAVMTGNAEAISEADTVNPGRWQNRVSGDKISFYFEDGELYRMVVERQATSLYHIVEGDTYKGANELSGDEIVIELEKGKARSVKVKSAPDVAEGKYKPPR